MGDLIIFIKSASDSIDRGWDPEDVAFLLRELGYSVLRAFVRTDDELASLIEANKSAIFWPVSYTVGAGSENPLIVSALEKAGCAYIGAGSQTARLSSKLEFKEAAAKSGCLGTPRYELIAGESPEELTDVQFPLVIKTEFTCNSQGIRFVSDMATMHGAINELRSLGQRIFVENWEREREFTVAYLPGTKLSAPKAACMELYLPDGRPVIDSVAKADNRLIRFMRPEAQLAQYLEELTIETARALKIDTHFRLDFVRNAQSAAFAIDLNLLPFLDNNERNVSYFPMAFALARTASFREIVMTTMNHGLERHGREKGISLGRVSAIAQ